MSGFNSKRETAADKLQEPNALTIAYQSGFYDGKKATLAQPAQEPVAWMCSVFGDDEVEYGTHQECENCVPLYTHPPQRTERDYERGFIDGMQKQAQSSVDKAVNAMSQPKQEPVAFDAFLESEDFYELMQAYRHFQTDAIKPFEAVKDALRAAHNIKKKNT